MMVKVYPQYPARVRWSAFRELAVLRSLRQRQGDSVVSEVSVQVWMGLGLMRADTQYFAG